MKKKIKEYLRRFWVLLLVFSFIVYYFPVSAFAASFDPVEPTFFDLFDFQPEDIRTYSTSTNKLTVTFDLPIGFSYLNYVEFFCYSNKQITSVSINGKSSEFSQYGNNYRIYTTASSATNLVVDFTFSTSSAWVYFSSAECLIGLNFYRTVPIDIHSTTGSTVNYSYISDPVNIPVELYSLTGYNNFRTRLYFEDLELYDYLTLSLVLCVCSITSISVGNFETFNIPFSVTYLDSYSEGLLGTGNTTYPNDYFYVKITIDLRDINWSDVGSIIVLNISGRIYSDVNRFNYFSINGCHGFTLSDNPDPVIFWFRKIYLGLGTWFNSTFSKLDNIFNELRTLNGSSDDAIKAQQTQEEINVSINNQLVGAVEDWNTNIMVVETGYDLAVTKTRPALLWLASLADGIFNGMGWFGNVYFVVGLISVLMLVLSKSGLASKIGSINRRKGD